MLRSFATLRYVTGTSAIHLATPRYMMSVSHHLHDVDYYFNPETNSYARLSYQEDSQYDALLHQLSRIICRQSCLM
jgi:hypothetical protein